MVFLKSIFFCISHIESNTCCTNEGQCIHWIWACNLLTAAQCRNCRHLLSYCFHENFVKATFLLQKSQKSLFHKIWEWISYFSTLCGGDNQCICQREKTYKLLWHKHLLYTSPSSLRRTITSISKRKKWSNIFYFLAKLETLIIPIGKWLFLLGFLSNSRFLLLLWVHKLSIANSKNCTMQFFQSKVLFAQCGI